MSCYAIHRKSRPSERSVVLVFPNRLLRSTFLCATAANSGYYSECTAKEVRSHMSKANIGTVSVCDMRESEYWDMPSLELAIERGLGDEFI